MFIQMIIGILR